MAPSGGGFDPPSPGVLRALPAPHRPTGSSARHESDPNGSAYVLFFSQVVYFHNAQYERQARVGLEDALDGAPMQVLPAICQLYPEVPLHYEEDHVDLSRPTGKWLWMVLPGRIYLVGPDERVYHSDNVTSLLRVYLELRD
jgi:hypothetical protein